MGEGKEPSVTVIAVETSSPVASVAICRGEGVVAERSVQAGTVYAEQLPVLLERMLAETGLSMERIDGLAVSIGPGSYTGLRVGLSLVKGLAYAAGKPLAAVPTLDVAAYGVPYCAFPVCVLLDARRGQVYTAMYSTETGWPERRSPFRAAGVEEVLETVPLPAVFAGSGAEAYRAQIQERGGQRAFFLPPGVGRLHAVPVAFLGLRAMQRGEYASLYHLEPLYLRRPSFVKPGAAGVNIPSPS
jgi:tRNA threonylcarbamoyladenosine biosynthesis protein TsaB